jgi:hypothetical protein
MERGSDRHNPRIDEELKHDTGSLLHGAPVESRSEESREQEGPADGEPTPDALLTGDAAPAASPDTLSHDEIEARAELARHLEPSVFPADRAALLASAQRQQAPAAVIERLSALPDGTYDHLEAVWEALGGRVEFRG